MADSAMNKRHSIFNADGYIYTPVGVPYIIQTHDQSGDGYDEWLYVYIMRRKTKTLVDYAPGGKKIIQPAFRDHYVGHCFWQRSISNIGVTALQYYGSILQPCDDLSCVVAIDPHDPPTEYTHHTDDTDTDQYQNDTAVTYEFAYDSSEGGAGSFKWDGGSYVNTVVNTNVKLDGGNAESGGIYVLRIKDTICFDLNEGDDPKDLEVFYLDPSYL